MCENTVNPSNKINCEMEGKIIQILDNAQTGSHNHMKNIKLLEKIYESSDYEQFLQYFLHILQGVIQEDHQNPCVKGILLFLAKFVGHFASIQDDEENSPDKDPPTHPFLKSVLQDIVKYHVAPVEDCRYNTCSFLSLTLRNVGENAAIDGYFIDLIQNAMLENIQDSKPLIRMQALLALSRLQDPLNPECPVIRAYINSLGDASHFVRREATKRIAPNAVTIPKLKQKTRDREPNVRSAAFVRIADIGIKYFKIVHKQYILKSGFSETNLQVKKIFFEYLLPKWLTDLNGSYLAFLRTIKLDGDEADILNSEKLSSEIMQVFFKTEPINKLIEALPLDENKLIPENTVASESAHYWNIIVKYLRQSPDLEEYLDQIIPELTIFCNYIDRVITNKFSKPSEEWEYLDFQYLLYHLLEVAEYYDLSEEVGRNTLYKLINKLLKKRIWQPRLLNKMMQIGTKLVSSIDSFTNDICIIISDIWQPLTDQLPSADDCGDLDFKIAEIKVKLNVLEGDQEIAIEEQDYEKAQKLKLEIEQYKRKMEKITSECTPVVQVRKAADDPETLCWCLDLLGALLVHGNVKNLSPSLITCRQEFLMPLIGNKNVEVARRAFKCLTVYCIFDQNLAEDQLKTLCVPIACYRITSNFNKTILMDSISVITDLIRMYGTDLFNTEDDNNSCSTVSTTRRRLYNEDSDDVDSINNRLTVDFIVSVLLDLLDDENDDVRDTAITAMAKLMLNKFPMNSMVMTRLILKWYNPSTRTAEGANTIDKRRNLNYEISLQQKLGVVFKAYTETIPNSREILGKSVVPILTNLAEAPRTSPLAEVDTDNVIKFLAAITDSGEVNGLLHLHTELGRILIHEISLRPSEVASIYFAKMLNFLNITPDESPAIKELITNAELILEKEALEKAPRHHVIKFISKLQGKPNNTTVNSTTNITNDTSANSTNNNNTTNVTTEEGQTTIHHRRLSAVIEEDNSKEADEIEQVELDEGNTVEEIPCKRRKIDLNSNPEYGRENMGTLVSMENESAETTENQREEVKIVNSSISENSQPKNTENQVGQVQSLKNTNSLNSKTNGLLLGPSNSTSSIRRTKRGTRLIVGRINKEKMPKKLKDLKCGKSFTSTSESNSSELISSGQDEQINTKRSTRLRAKNGQKLCRNTGKPELPTAEFGFSKDSDDCIRGRRGKGKQVTTEPNKTNNRKPVSTQSVSTTDSDDSYMSTRRKSKQIASESKKNNKKSVSAESSSNNESEDSFRSRRSTQTAIEDKQKNKKSVSAESSSNNESEDSFRSRRSTQAPTNTNKKNNKKSMNVDSALHIVSGDNGFRSRRSKQATNEVNKRNNSKSTSAESSSNNDSEDSFMSGRNKHPATVAKKKNNKNNNVVNKLGQKENLIQQPVPPRINTINRAKLHIGSPTRKSERNKLREKQENYDKLVTGKELVIKISGVPRTAYLPTVQVKRKKLTDDDSPKNSPKRSLRSLQVASETSSDESSPTRLIRKSNRTPKKKILNEFT